MKAIRYHVVRNMDMDAFVREVNHYLEAGWQPSGGVVSTVISDTTNAPYPNKYVVEYAQALVLYERT